jgi:hypothetical protein
LHFADDIYSHDKKVMAKMFKGQVNLAKN